MVQVLLKPGLENFEHYFAIVWDECNCVVVWTFFHIALLWDWNENTFSKRKETTFSSPVATVEFQNMNFEGYIIQCIAEAKWAFFHRRKYKFKYTF